jgi:aminopeptidase
MYKLEQNLLENYAQVMVRYALNNGAGIKKGDTVFLVGQECSKDLYMEICKEIWSCGGNVIMRYLPDEVDRSGLNRSLLEIGTHEQITFFPQSFWQGVTDAMDHIMFILADPDIHRLEDIPAEKITQFESAYGPFRKMRDEKETRGALSWTLCIYGTQSMADEASLSIEDYWEQIIQACYLREADPVATWKATQKEIKRITNELTNLSIETVHVEGEGVDLEIKIGEHRKWLGGTGHNIPSFEIFTSPDWRGTNGFIRFNQPLYDSGKRISGIELQFKNGIVVSASAKENEAALFAMLSVPNADKIGEFSLTDRRLSRITKPMANPLFDENMSGLYGNTHIALGSSYKTAFAGNMQTMEEKEFAALGFNQCPPIHVDIISTTYREVTAKFFNGNKKVIYRNGEFVI